MPEDATELASAHLVETPDTRAVFRGKRALVIVAHPDDEVLFAASLLGEFRELSILHTMDGALSRRRAQKSGFARRCDYVVARRKELDVAFRVGGLRAECRDLAIRDGRTCLQAARIIEEVQALIRSFAPDVILTHAYEGGHRDHDTTAFAVGVAAMRQNAQDLVWEMACYHGVNSALETGVPPGWDSAAQITVSLSQPEMAVKRAMLDCFRTQYQAVQTFATSIERFRQPALLDFSVVPSAGRLGYGSTESGAEGAVWRRLMAAFLPTNRPTLRRGLGLQMLRVVVDRVCRPAAASLWHSRVS